MGESVKRSIQHSLQRKIPMSYPMSFKKFLDAGAPNIFFKAVPNIVQEDLTGQAKEKKLKQLETLLKGHDWWYSMSSDNRAYQKGSATQDAIRKLVDEIGSEGMKMYREYGKKAGVMESIDKTTPRLNAYEKLLHKKLKDWNLQSLDDVDNLEPEPRKRFNDELDKAWTSIKDNVEDVVFHESNPPRNLSNAIRQVTDRSGLEKERMV